MICLFPRFAVELEELDKVTGKDLEKTAEATFKVAGVSTVDTTKLAQTKVSNL